MKKTVKFLILTLTLIFVFSLQISLAASPDEITITYQIVRPGETLHMPKGIRPGGTQAIYVSSIVGEPYYAGYFAGINEISLHDFDLKENIAIYRLFFVEHPYLVSPTMVRIEIDTIDKTGLLIIKIRNPLSSGNNELERFFTKIRTLTYEECDEFLKIIDGYSFWNIEHRETPSFIGLDSTEWWIEAKYRDNYHAVSRWYFQPELSGKKSIGNEKVHAIGKYMLYLADYNNFEEEVLNYYRAHLHS